jgi:hypothetical protein
MARKQRDSVLDEPERSQIRVRPDGHRGNYGTDAGPLLLRDVRVLRMHSQSFSSSSLLCCFSNVPCHTYMLKSFIFQIKRITGIVAALGYFYDRVVTSMSPTSPESCALDSSSSSPRAPNKAGDARLLASSVPVAYNESTGCSARRAARLVPPPPSPDWCFHRQYGPSRPRASINRGRRMCIRAFYAAHLFTKRRKP